MSPSGSCLQAPKAFTLPSYHPPPFLQTLAALPDQDSFYDVTDALEQQGMEALVQRHLGAAGTDIDLRAQLVLYEVGSGLGCQGPTEEGREGAPFPSARPTSVAHTGTHVC